MQLASVDERGTLEQLSFALLLIRALDRRWSGTLLVGTDDEEHVIELDRGLVCRVLVPDEHARLGEIMVDAEVIQEEERDKALARKDSLFGAAIIEAGIIDDETLQRALVLQLLKRLERLFAYPLTTAWAFGSDVSAFEGMPPGVRIDTLRALWAGLSAHGEMGPWLETSMARIADNPFRVRADINLRRFGFTGDARKAVKMVRDKRMSFGELVEEAVAPEEVCRCIVYLLAITRYLDFTAEEANASKPPLQSASSDSVDEMPSISDEPTSEDSVVPPPDSSDRPATKERKIRAPRRVARIALRRVAVARAGGAAPDPPGSGDNSSRGGKRRKSSGRLNLASEIQGRLVRLEDESPFQLLGLDPSRVVDKGEDAIFAIVLEHYDRAAKRWNPDSCPEGLEELKEGMAKIHDAIEEAFALLSDPETRELFLEDEPVAPPSSGSGAVSSPSSAPASAPPSAPSSPPVSDKPASSKPPGDGEAVPTPKSGSSPEAGTPAPPSSKKPLSPTEQPPATEEPAAEDEPASKKATPKPSASTPMKTPALGSALLGGGLRKKAAASKSALPRPKPKPKAPKSAPDKPSPPSAKRPVVDHDDEEDPVSGERAVEMLMMSATELHAKALTAFSEQKLEEAERLVKAASNAEPENPDFLASSAWICANQAKPSLHVALMDLDDVLDRFPDHVTARYYRGVIRRRVGEPDGARSDFEEVLEARPDHDGAKAELATLKKASQQ